MFPLEVRARGEDNQEGDQPNQQMEKDAEGVHLDESREGRASRGTRVKCRGGAERGAENRGKIQDAAIAGEWLQQH